MYYKSFTSLRGLFILGIVLFHMNEVFHSNPPIFQFISVYGGTMGNAFFFMLSGLLITRKYKDRIANNTISFNQFIKKRIVKLYPLYLLTNIITIAIIILSHGISTIEKKRVLFTVIMLTPHPFNTPTWFVNMLLFCYIFFSLLVYISQKRISSFYLATIAITLIATVFVCTKLAIPDFLYRNTWGLVCFCMGILLERVLNHISNYPNKNYLYGSILILTCYLIVLNSPANSYLDGIGNRRLDFTFILCPLIIILSSIWPQFNKVLSIKPLYLLGKSSMYIFYIHAPLLELFSFITKKYAQIAEYTFSLYLCALFIVVYIMRTLTNYAKKPLSDC